METVMMDEKLSMGEEDDWIILDDDDDDEPEQNQSSFNNNEARDQHHNENPPVIIDDEPSIEKSLQEEGAKEEEEEETVIVLSDHHTENNTLDNGKEKMFSTTMSNKKKLLFSSLNDSSSSSYSSCRTFLFDIIKKNKKKACIAIVAWSLIGQSLFIYGSDNCCVVLLVLLVVLCFVSTNVLVFGFTMHRTEKMFTTLSSKKNKKTFLSSLKSSIYVWRVFLFNFLFKRNKKKSCIVVVVILLLICGHLSYVGLQHQSAITDDEHHDFFCGLPFCDNACSCWSRGHYQSYLADCCFGSFLQNRRYYDDVMHSKPRPRMLSLEELLKQLDDDDEEEDNEDDEVNDYGDIDDDDDEEAELSDEWLDALIDGDKLINDDDDDGFETYSIVDEKGHFSNEDQFDSLINQMHKQEKEDEEDFWGNTADNDPYDILIDKILKEQQE